MPTYFAGTNARISGRAAIDGGSSIHILWTRLSLNGEQVSYHSYPFPALPPYIVEDTAAVMFDSSHWPAYSNVEIKFEASDESGHYFVTT